MYKSCLFKRFSTIFTAPFCPYIPHEQNAQNLILSVRLLLFALVLTEHHCSQNHGLLKSEERLRDFKERCAQLWFLIYHIIWQSYIPHMEPLLFLLSDFFQSALIDVTSLKGQGNTIFDLRFLHQTLPWEPLNGSLGFQFLFYTNSLYRRAFSPLWDTSRAIFLLCELQHGKILKDVWYTAGHFSTVWDMYTAKKFGFTLRASKNLCQSLFVSHHILEGNFKNKKIKGYLSKSFFPQCIPHRRKHFI